MTPYDYPDPVENFDRQINHWAQLKAETGAPGLAEKVAEIKSIFDQKLAELRDLPDDPALRAAEPDDLARHSRAASGWPAPLLDRACRKQTYRDRLEAAWLGRCAGNVLGSIVELWEPDQMQRWAAYLGDDFPPTDYWSAAERPHELKYETSLREDFTRAKMDGVPTDDDLIYTQLGLLILEDYGIDFSVEDVGAAWLKYLPVSPASPVLPNLQAGVPAREAAVVDNPTQFWIIGDIQSDPGAMPRPAIPSWPPNSPGAAPPSPAAATASTVGCMSPPSSPPPSPWVIRWPRLKPALAEIPADCVLAREVRWALDAADGIKDYRAARAAADQRYAGMHPVHTINNAALTIWGLSIGGDDFTRLIGETVAMGLDNDCTAATAASIFGAAYGKDAIPKHWYKNFNNKSRSFIIGIDSFAIDDMIDRFTAQAQTGTRQPDSPAPIRRKSVGASHWLAHRINPVPQPKGELGETQYDRIPASARPAQHLRQRAERRTGAGPRPEAQRQSALPRGVLRRPAQTLGSAPGQRLSQRHLRQARRYLQVLVQVLYARPRFQQHAAG